MPICRSLARRLVVILFLRMDESEGEDASTVAGGWLAMRWLRDDGAGWDPRPAGRRI